ncbi:MAG: hypothetical protein KIT84_20440 [Labilithrix sp.]|nr:hypothetical protein [Labilithrix sp.]MCW5813409.1 hypothetical protein [Labilithrix sp.]
MSPRRELVALAVVLVATASAAAKLRRAAPPPPAGVPGPARTFGYVTSAACVACHPSEHASFRRTWHRTMTQVATPDTVLAPFERREGAVLAPDGARIVLTTGAHREQAYWTAGDRPGELRIVPWVWLPRERALVPRHDAFLFPPNEPLPDVRWGGSCIACHAVAGEPRRDAAKDTWDTRAAELGVACEACHGPGAEHASLYRDPVARYARGRDPKIVQPKKLAPERANAVCGQCHAYAFPRDEAAWWQDGYARTFRPGDTLAASRALLRPDAMNGEEGAPVIDAPASAIFWPDGDVRVGGRELNGLVGSRCKAGCLDCHAMHAGDPAGQLAPGFTCLGCHDTERARTHSRHGPEVLCVDCHMPKTSYALLEGVRSHRIAIPRAEHDDLKPSACDLCHLDRNDAYGVRAGIAGDAGVRALVADALARFPAPRFAVPLLDAMKEDPYAAVRFIAARSRRRFGDIATPPLDPALVRSLLAARDDRAITIAE